MRLVASIYINKYILYTAEPLLTDSPNSRLLHVADILHCTDEHATKQYKSTPCTADLNPDNGSMQASMWRKELPAGSLCFCLKNITSLFTNKPSEML